jgi:hypothetical protein
MRGMRTTKREMKETNLFFILRFGVNDDFGKEGLEEVFEDFNSHVKLSPIMTVFKDIEHIAFEINFTVEISVMEDLIHRIDLFDSVR